MTSYKLWIGGHWVESENRHQVLSPYDSHVVCESHLANQTQMESALHAAHKASQMTLPSRYLRSRLLEKMAHEIEKNKDKFVESIISEGGKPRASAEVEVARAISTFTLAHEEAKRFIGEVIPMDIDKGTRFFTTPSLSIFVPRGVVLAITPFNFPINLVAHKVAPALAVGAPVIVKAAPQTPGGATLLGEIFERVVAEISDSDETFPKEFFQVVHTTNEITENAVKDPRVATLSFTGSDTVGWMLQGKAIRKKVLLELGGNAGVIVHHDGNIKRAAQRCAAGGFGYAGQTCISVQRILVHEKVFLEFTDYLVSEAKALKSGSPADKNVTVGPLINKAAADRVIQWMDEALSSGAKELAGSQRKDNVITPAVFVNVPSKCKINCEEVFGPVVVVDKYSDFDSALSKINDSRFGLQAGVFTENQSLVEKSFRTLSVGAVIVNEIPTFRADHMPYGGVKDSGLGREGLRYAMEDYCERRTLVTWMGKSK